MSTRAHVTDAELMAQPRDGRKRELVDGEVRVMSPAGIRHEVSIGRLATRLGAFLEASGLGVMTASNAGFRMTAGNVGCPDLAYVPAGRFGQGMPEGFSDVAPDLAIEVMSPGDTEREVLDKVGEYLTSGVLLVWVIDPHGARAAVYRSATRVRIVDEDGDLDGEDVLPGFRCRLADVLA